MKRHNMLRADVGQFSKAGLELAACGNTVTSQKVSLKDLLPGFISRRERRRGPPRRAAIARISLSAALIATAT